MGGFRAPETLELLPTYWRVRPGPGVCARLLAGTAVSWSLAVGLRDPRAHSKSFVVWGLVSDTVGYEVWGVPKLVLAC